MTSVRCSIVAALVLIAGLPALAASAEPTAILSAHDVALYRAAFEAAERGDRTGAEQALEQVGDRCLAGRVQYLELTHSRNADYKALADWLRSFGDLPGARNVYRMAVKLKPAGVAPPSPGIAEDADLSYRLAATPESKPARDAYYAGDVQRALELARRSGDAWIAGLAAWRQGDYADALVSFETLARNPTESDEARAAGGVWGARAAAAGGFAGRADPLLKIAARSRSFYGMIARRKLELAADPLGALIARAQRGAAPAPDRGETAVAALARTDVRAHRALALMQLDRQLDAGEELRAGLSSASDDGARAAWMGLIYEVSPDHPTGEVVLQAQAPSADGAAAYPAPALNPAGGFTVDKALVYAVVWQESRFNSLAVSPVGAVGLMQLMPPSAANMAGDDSIATNPITLFDMGKNLQLGQAYLSWLEQNAAGHDVLRTLAAYNAGPSALNRAQAQVGPDADSLTLIESLPYGETRAYVKKVMAAYWCYRRQFGASTPTLDAVASDLPLIDARLDPPLQDAPKPSSASLQNAQAATAPAREALEVLLHRSS